jgi:hypothetical protein
MGMVFGKVDVECAAHDTLQLRGGTASAAAAGFAVRRYHPHVLARVRRGATVKENQMFGILATYIGVYGTPKNTGAGAAPRQIAMTAPVISSVPQQIAMTAPVVSERESDMAFVLPAKYTAGADAPQPTDSRVELVDIPSRLVAVKTFSGSYDYTSSQEIAAKFQAELEDFGLECKSSGAWQLARYNPPFTLWWLRTNEIWVDIKENSKLIGDNVETTVNL